MKRVFKYFRNVFSGGSSEKRRKLKDVRVLMIGLDAAGKTSIVYSYKLDNDVNTVIPTIGFSVETVKLKNMDLTMWDVGGEDKIRPLWRYYYNNTDGVLFVIDSNDRERLSEALDEFARLLKEEQLCDSAFMVLWNKQDLPNAFSIEYGRKIINELENARESAVVIMPTVAFTQEGVPEAIALFQTLMEAQKKDRVKIVDALSNRLIWTPNDHMRFPKAFREKIWTLLLIAMKTDHVFLPLEIVYEIASFLPVETLQPEKREHHWKQWIKKFT